MDSENETTNPELSDSLYDFINSHSVEELYAIIKDLGAKHLLEKESRIMIEGLIEETQQTLAQTREQNKAAQVQIVQYEKQVEMLRGQLQTAKAEKVTTDQAQCQRSKQDKQSSLTPEQQAELRSKLEAQRARASELQDRVDNFEKQKAMNHQNYADCHVALNQRSSELLLLKEEFEEEEKRLSFVQSKFVELKDNVENLCADIRRLNHKLANPTKEEVDGGKTLFDQVMADKKTLEAELVNLIELTTGFRHQIRQKQDELEELEANEHESLIHSVDMEYVLSKMRFLLKDDDVVCMALAEIESKFNAYIQQIEQSITDAEGKPVAFSGQYNNLRGFSLDCLKVVKRECVQGLVLLKERFKEFEQLANDYADLQERITHAK